MDDNTKSGRREKWVMVDDGVVWADLENENNLRLPVEAQEWCVTREGV